MNFDISGGWGWVKTVVHLGGDIGGVLAEILVLHPQLHGTLVDFPRVVARRRCPMRLASRTGR